MASDLKISGVSVVFLGDFAPRTFHPAWFAQKNLLPQQEADNAKLEIAHQDFTGFTTEWLHLRVSQEQFALISMKDDALPLLRDLVLGTFHFFSETPVRAIGINRDCHFQMESEQTWHAIGDRLTPKEPWKDLLPKPGMLSVKMQGLREDKAGAINVTVQPSIKVTPHGVYVQVNDHYNIKEGAGIPGALKLFSEVWASSLERSAKIASALVSV